MNVFSHAVYCYACDTKRSTDATGATDATLLVCVDSIINDAIDESVISFQFDSIVSFDG